MENCSAIRNECVCVCCVILLVPPYQAETSIIITIFDTFSLYWTTATTETAIAPLPLPPPILPSASNIWTFECDGFISALFRIFLAKICYFFIFSLTLFIRSINVVVVVHSFVPISFRQNLVQFATIQCIVCIAHSSILFSYFQLRDACVCVCRFSPLLNKPLQVCLCVYCLWINIDEIRRVFLAIRPWAMFKIPFQSNGRPHFIVFHRPFKILVLLSVAFNMHRMVLV